jgi:hypothetical protein
LLLTHVHYARECTLAEAFYQLVFGPYRLLILGLSDAGPVQHVSAKPLELLVARQVPPNRPTPKPS